MCADLSGRWNFRIRAFKIGAAQRNYSGSGRRVYDGGFCYRDFLGATYNHERDARACHERLQRRLPRRNAFGKFVVGMVGPDL